MEHLKKIYTTPPENELYIKSKINNIIYGESEEMDVQGLRVDYGIESYFVPEGRGMEIEKEQRSGQKRVDAKVIIDKYGNAIIKSLLIDGKEIEF